MKIRQLPSHLVMMELDRDRTLYVELYKGFMRQGRLIGI